MLVAGPRTPIAIEPGKEKVTRPGAEASAWKYQ